MKKTNLGRIVWIIGIYAILVSILYLIITYKVKWEGKDLNKYLYFYECSDSLCTSDIKKDVYYNKIVCQNGICPYIDSINNELLILNNGKKEWIYNYVNGEIINDKYNSYKPIDNNYYVVVNDTGLQGVIDTTGKVVVDDQYEYISDYKDDYLVYKYENMYRIKNVSNDYEIDANYETAKIINNKLYYYLDNGSYYIASFSSEKPVNAAKYDYVESFNNVIFTIYNKKIDIIDTDLKSTLILNIPTYYEYKEEKERDSLNTNMKDDLLYFQVVTNDEKIINYKYDLKNKRIIQ